MLFIKIIRRTDPERRKPVHFYHVSYLTVRSPVRQGFSASFSAAPPSFSRDDPGLVWIDYFGREK